MEKKTDYSKKTAFTVNFMATTAALALSIAIFFFFYRFDGVVKFVNSIINILMPFIYGAAFAYLLSPVCNFFEKLFLKAFAKLKNPNGISEALSIVVSIILALVVIMLFFVAVIPQIYESALGIVKMAPAAYKNCEGFLTKLLADYPEQAAYIGNNMNDVYDKFQKWMSTDMLNSLGQVAGSVGSGINNVVNVFKNLFLGFLVAIYMLFFRRRFAKQSKMALYGLFPKRFSDLVYEEVIYADKMFSGFLYGKVVDSAIIGGICFVGCIILGLEFPVLISMIVGVTNIIPFFGPYIGMIPSTLILLIVNPMHSLYFLIFIIILQQVDGNVIGPKILGNSTGLSSFWILFSILFFGGVWGFIGMIVGVPVFATIYDIVRKLIYRGLRKKNIKIE